MIRANIYIGEGIMAFRLMIESNGRRHIVLVQVLVVHAVANSCLFGIDGGKGRRSGRCVVAIEAHVVTTKAESWFRWKLV